MNYKLVSASARRIDFHAFFFTFTSGNTALIRRYQKAAGCGSLLRHTVLQQIHRLKKQYNLQLLFEVSTTVVFSINCIVNGLNYLVN